MSHAASMPDTGGMPLPPRSAGAELLPDPGPPILPLRVERVSYCVPRSTLLTDIDLRLEPGGCSVILGPNGAGKSLLLRLCHGLLAPTAGRIDWNGVPRDAAKRHQAMVAQTPVLLRRSVRANLEYPLKLRRMPRAQRRRRVEEALAGAGLQAQAKQPARLLSGGEQQRLALARACIARPQLLFLDEPASNLDPAATRRVEAMIADILAEGVTVVMATHDLGQARRLADRAVFLHRGRLLEHTAARDFFARPASAEAVAFMKGELIW